MIRSLPGLSAPPGTAAERRRWLAGLNRAELAEHIVQLGLGLRQGGVERYAELAGAVGLPLAEAVASPFAVRALTLAAEIGAHVNDHELRAQPPWPSEWRAADDVADEAHATWDRGVLQVGKYQSFLQDEPLSTFNPNHMSKWGPHELLHRVSRFFYRPGMTRWELYLGARLNELVPVVFWYGPDEVLRLDREGFDRARDASDREARLEAALWLGQSEAELRERAERDADHLLAGIAHFEREIEAIDREIAFGRQVRVPHALVDTTLDASTDAIAYVVGHEGRLGASSTAGLMAGLLREDRDYIAGVRAYRAFVENVLDRLLFEPLAFSPEQAAARASGRRLWDLFNRVAQCGDRAWRRVGPLLDEAREAIDGTSNGATIELEGWRERIAAALGSRLAEVVLAVGDTFRGADFGLLGEGLASAVPATAAALGRGALEVAEQLAGGPHLRRRLPLTERFAAHLAEAGADANVLDLLAFEGALLAAGRRSDQVERLSGAAEPSSDAWIVANAGFSVVRLGSDAAAVHAGWAETGELTWADAGPVAYLVGAYLDGIAVVPAPRELMGAWGELLRGPMKAGELLARLAVIDESREDWPRDSAAWLEELLQAGAVGWFPAL